MEQYYIGQIFEGKYPPMAACWCNMNNAYIDKIEDNKYEIKEVPGPSESEIIAQEVAELKTYLDSTDWIIDKISEAKEYQPELVDEMIEKYRPTAEKRIAARERINELENK